MNPIPQEASQLEQKYERIFWGQIVEALNSKPRSLDLSWGENTTESLASRDDIAQVVF